MTPDSSPVLTSSTPSTHVADAVVEELTLQDFVASHGYGDATPEGLKLGLDLVHTGDDFATAAAEVVARGLTTAQE